jgi:hypothetical protein
MLTCFAGTFVKWEPPFQESEFVLGLDESLLKCAKFSTFIFDAGLTIHTLIQPNVTYGISK